MVDLVCQCSVKGVKRHEWFGMLEKEALRTVKIWRSFIQGSPYKGDGSLEAFWADRIDAIKETPKDWNHDDYTSRHERWEAFISPNPFDILLYKGHSCISSLVAQDRLLNNWALIINCNTRRGSTDFRSPLCCFLDLSLITDICGYAGLGLNLYLLYMFFTS